VRALVVFDSEHGNTRTVASAVAATLGSDVRARPVSGLDTKELEGLDLLVAGSPIHAWKPSPRMQSFLAALKPDQLKGTKAAAFDTRVKIFFHGDAAGKITRLLKKAGAEIVAEPAGFDVLSREGPLADGEAARAKGWARRVKESVAARQNT
jgi:flavodoxin